MAIEPWVSVEQVAAHLGVTKDSVYRWNAKKGLPARRLGRLWKRKLSEMDAWVEAAGGSTGIEAKDENNRGRNRS